MQNKKLSWAQALRFGRDAILSNPVRTLGLLSPISLVMLADIWLTNNGAVASTARIIIDVALCVIAFAISTGAMKLCLIILDGKVPEVRDYLVPLRTILNTSMVTILIILIFIVGVSVLGAGGGHDYSHATR